MTWRALTGWLRQDTGDLERAQYCSDRALECATELGDTEQVTYVLMRKSNVATDEGQAARALGLAQAALASRAVAYAAVPGGGVAAAGVGVCPGR